MSLFNIDTNKFERKACHIVWRTGEHGMAFIVNTHRTDLPLEDCEVCLANIEWDEDK